MGTAPLPGRTGQGAPSAAARPVWASEVTRDTPDKPRALRPRKNCSQPASNSAEQTFPAEDLTVPVGVELCRLGSRWLGANKPGSARRSHQRLQCTTSWKGLRSGLTSGRSGRSAG